MSGTTAGTKAIRLSARSFLSSGFVIHICFNTVRCAVPSHAERGPSDSASFDDSKSPSIELLGSSNDAESER